MVFGFLSGKPPVKAKAKKAEEAFEVDYQDEAFILKLTDDIVEDVAYTLHLEDRSHPDAAKLAMDNPYRNKESRELLKYKMNIALRKLVREKKVHLGKKSEKGGEHKLVAYLKPYLFEAVRNEILSPSM